MNASLLVLSIASLTAGPPQDVLYDFYGPNCGYCQMMMPAVERLQAEGLPVVKVNVEENQRLAQRYGVQVLPTLVLVVGGLEQQRLTGYQDESALRRILERIPKRAPSEARSEGSFQPPRAGRQLPVRAADDESKSKWDLGFHLPLPAFSGRKEKMVPIEPASQGLGARSRGMSVVSNTKGEAPRANEQAEADARAKNGPADPDVPKTLASSVRIRVKDAGGVYFSSGVVIDSAPGRSVVLTCGHGLRDVKPESQIEVDVFSGKNARTFRGTIEKFDLNADVGLLTLQTPSPVASTPIAAKDEYVIAGETVVSIGCSGGKAPTIERMRVTALNRYQGPDTIECTGAPAQGRSGGGLFTARGKVVGVCTNADPNERRGIYAGLKPVYELLHSAGMDDLLPSAAKPNADALADVQPSTPGGEPAADDPAPRRQDDSTPLPPAPARQSAGGARDAVAAHMSLEEESSTRAMEDAEVICIIRPINQPKSATRVVIINRASRKFMAYLKGESQDHLVSTSEQMPAAETATEFADPGGRHELPRKTDLHSQITAAWKPTTPAATRPQHQWIRTAGANRPAAAE